MVSESKYTGCILGQCLGDALGFPVEGHLGQTCRQFIDEFVTPWFEGNESYKSEWFGQYTDDSQLARELLASLVKNRGWVPEDYARRIAEIFREQKIVGQGLACDDAANKLIHGAKWDESGVPAPSAGNGTAMRAAPVGLFYHNSPEDMIRIAHEQGWITHHDPRCSAGSVAIAGAVALAARGELESAESFVGQLAEWMSVYSKECADLVCELPAWLYLPPDEAVLPISKAGVPDDFKQGWPGISPFVVSSVLWSLYAFLRHPDSYKDAISVAIAVGGDVDTTAAMTGAISGAYLGIENLPTHLVTRVQDRGEWGYDELVGLCEGCWGIVNN